MRRAGKIGICLFLLSACFLLPAQGGSTGPKEKSFREEMKSDRQVRKERREKKKLEKEERKAIEKHHKRIQTKAVRKRMKASRRKSKRYNDNKREFFLVRWYKKVF